MAEGRAQERQLRLVPTWPSVLQLSAVRVKGPAFGFIIVPEQHLFSAEGHSSGDSSAGKKLAPQLDFKLQILPAHS